MFFIYWLFFFFFGWKCGITKKWKTFSLVFHSPIPVPTPTLISFPFYTLLLVDPSWWWNIPLVRGSLHLWDLSGSLSLYHCSYMSRHVVEVRLKLWYWEDFLVTCVYCWILCSAGGFSQSTTLYPWQRQILVGMLMSRWSIFNYALHSQGGSYSSFPLQ